MGPATRHETRVMVVLLLPLFAVVALVLLLRRDRPRDHAADADGPGGTFAMTDNKSAPNAPAPASPLTAPPVWSPSVTTLSSADYEAGIPDASPVLTMPTEQAPSAERALAVTSASAALAATELSPDANIDAGVPQQANAAEDGAPIGAGKFLTAPPAWAASAMTQNPEAGAGAFTTETPRPAGFVYFGVTDQ